MLAVSIAADGGVVTVKVGMHQSPIINTHVRLTVIQQYPFRPININWPVCGRL